MQLKNRIAENVKQLVGKEGELEVEVQRGERIFSLLPQPCYNTWTDGPDISVVRLLESRRKTKHTLKHTPSLLLLSKHLSLFSLSLKQLAVLLSPPPPPRPPSQFNDLSVVTKRAKPSRRASEREARRGRGERGSQVRRRCCGRSGISD